MTTRLSAIDVVFNDILRLHGAALVQNINQHNANNPDTRIGVPYFLVNLRKMVINLLDPKLLLRDIGLPDAEDDFHVGIINGEIAVSLTWWDENNVTWAIDFDFDNRFRSLSVFERLLETSGITVDDRLFKNQAEQHLSRFPQFWDTVDDDILTASPQLIEALQFQILTGDLFLDDSDVESPPSLPRKKITRRKKSPIKKKGKTKK